VIPVRALLATSLAVLLVACTAAPPPAPGTDAAPSPTRSAAERSPSPLPELEPPPPIDEEPPRTGPGPRAYAQMVDLPGPGVLLYHGQIAPPDHPDSGWYQDMWVFTGEDGWQKPESRCDFEGCVDGVPATFTDGLGFDAESNRVVVADGKTTVAWDPSSGAWEDMAAPGPTGMLGARTAYDAQADRLIKFGGWDPLNDETWAYDFDANTWSEMSPEEHPVAGNFQAMAYDARSDRVILFGGADRVDVALPDTWAYDYESDTWTLMSPATSPPPRYYSTMVYDDSNDRTILFAGTDQWASATLGDTWAYDHDADTWTQIDAPGPTVRAWHAMAYDADSKSVVAFGGGLDRVAVTDETWILDGTTDTWRLHAPLTFDDSGCTYGGPTQLRAGDLSIDFINASDGPAAAQMFALDMDATFADLLAHVEEELRRLDEGLEMMGHPDFTTLVGEISVEAQGSGELAAQLQPGRYALVCADFDPGTRGLYPYGPITALE
jgi:hypothetical protein